MKKIKINIIIGIIIVISSLVILIFPSKVGQPVSQGEIGINQENVQEKEIFLVINDGEGNLKTLKAEFSKGMTVFDLLKNKAEELNIPLKIKTYDFGIFIEAIGNKKNGQDEKYWMYYVNDEMPMVSVDKKEVNPGDKVEFRFEKSPF